MQLVQIWELEVPVDLPPPGGGLLEGQLAEKIWTPKVCQKCPFFVHFKGFFFNKSAEKNLQKASFSHRHAAMEGLFFPARGGGEPDPPPRGDLNPPK